MLPCPVHTYQHVDNGGEEGGNAEVENKALWGGDGVSQQGVCVCVCVCVCVVHTH